jgi:hypothetical protein
VPLDAEAKNRERKRRERPKPPPLDELGEKDHVPGEKQRNEDDVQQEIPA